MSYVFSKALQPKPEQERNNSEPLRWSVPPPLNRSNSQGKAPPPVARKPSTGSVPTQISKPPARRISLPARAQSFDADYGTGPKMGGKAFWIIDLLQ